MIAFTQSTIPKIIDSVDFLNIMTYDLMNRRDNVTKHHTGLNLSLEAIDTYLERGVPREKANLGLAYYVKWFKTAEEVDCTQAPLGCKTELMEDPSNGADLGKAGAFSWHDQVPYQLSASFQKAMRDGIYDTSGGGYYYWDKQERIFWSFDTPDAISKKIPAIVNERELGGAFAWALGEDAPGFEHLKASNMALANLPKGEATTPRERNEL